MTIHLLPYSPERDVYRLLGIRAEASTAEVVDACRRLSRAFHPDRNMSPRATREMQLVNAVRHVLTDPEARSEYDVARRRWLAARAMGAAPMHDAWPPLEVVGPTPATQRYVRATWAGVRATFAALSPPRCGRCRTVIGNDDDAYCVVCGLRLLGGIRPMARRRAG